MTIITSSASAWRHHLLTTPPYVLLWLSPASQETHTSVSSSSRHWFPAGPSPSFPSVDALWRVSFSKVLAQSPKLSMGSTRLSAFSATVPRFVSESYNSAIDFPLYFWQMPQVGIRCLLFNHCPPGNCLLLPAPSLLLPKVVTAQVDWL